MSAYLKFFELNQSPFEQRAQSQVVLGTRALREAFTTIRDGLDEGASRVCVDGGVGMGKTSLARALPKLLDDQTRVALIPDAALPWEACRTAVARQWGLESGGLARTGLIEAARKQRLVLTIDCAEHASEDFLDHLDVLLSYRTEEDRPVVQSVLFARLSREEGEAPAPLLWWLDRIQTLQLEFAPLPREGIESYLHKNLKRAGWTGPPLFDSTAATAVHARTGGIPGEIALLCEKLLIEAASRKLTAIDADFIEAFCDGTERVLDSSQDAETAPLAAPATPAAPAAEAVPGDAEAEVEEAQVEEAQVESATEAETRDAGPTSPSANEGAQTASPDEASPTPADTDGVEAENEVESDDGAVAQSAVESDDGAVAPIAQDETESMAVDALVDETEVEAAPGTPFASPAGSFEAALEFFEAAASGESETGESRDEDVACANDDPASEDEEEMDAAVAATSDAPVSTFDDEAGISEDVSSEAGDADPVDDADDAGDIRAFADDDYGYDPLLLPPTPEELAQIQGSAFSRFARPLAMAAIAALVGGIGFAFLGGSDDAPQSNPASANTAQLEREVEPISALPARPPAEGLLPPASPQAPPSNLFAPSGGFVAPKPAEQEFAESESARPSEGGSTAPVAVTPFGASQTGEDVAANEGFSTRDDPRGSEPMEQTPENAPASPASPFESP